MNSDDLRRLFLGPTLFRLDTILAPRMVPILYAAGLLALLVWGINHLFWTFGGGFSSGVWGIVEILVFGLLWLIILRIACEGLLVFFRAHATAVDTVMRTRTRSSLLEEVGDAIHDLAESEVDTVTITEPVPSRPQPPAKRTTTEVTVTDTPPKPTVVRRTAKRTPPGQV